MGVPENFLRPCPLERRETLLLENTCSFLRNFHRQSGSEKISMKIDKISLRLIKHEANQVRKYIISLNKIKHLENEQKGSQSRRTDIT